MRWAGDQLVHSDCLVSEVKEGRQRHGDFAFKSVRGLFPYLKGY